MSLSRRLATAIAALGVAAGAAATAVAAQPSPGARADDPYGPWVCVAKADYGVCVYPPVRFDGSPSVRA